MPVPSPRNSIRIARGNFADLDANASAFGDGEFIYAIDQDRFYTSVSGVLTAVGAGTITTQSIDRLADVDTSTIPPGVGQVLKWDGANWIPADDNNTDAVTSVAGKTGDVTLIKADITDFSDADYATAAQGDTADTAVQPGDNVSDLTNDANYIDAAGAPIQSVNTQTGDVVLDADDIDDTLTTNKFATATQLGLADTSVQPGDNVSDLANDANYIDASGAPVQSVNTQTGDVVLGAGDVGLGNVDNTSDANKPISTATQTALDAKADLVDGVIPTSQIPAIAITEFLGSVGSEAAMLALVGQQGDWCLRTDKAVGYVITGADPSLIANWEAFTVPGSAVTTINTQVGDVVLGAADVGAATAAQGALADTAVQPTDSIDVLADVDISTTAPTDGQALIWDNTGGKFVPGEAGLVDSVNTQTGDVVLDTDDIGEGTTNLYSQWDNATGGINYAGGNVGIGTESPQQALEISASVPVVRLTDTDGTSQYGEIQSNAGNVTISSRNDASNGAIIFRGLAANEYARITSDGRVGIGTTNPAQALHVTGSLKLNDQATSPSIYLRDDDAAGDAQFTQRNSGDLAFINGATTRSIIFETGGSEAARITSGGLVGIGTSSPDELLHIRGDLAEFKGTNTNSINATGGTEQVFKFGIEGQKNGIFGPAGSIIFRQDSRTWSSVEANNKPTRIEFCTQDFSTTDESETPRLVVDQSGRVGIGTTDPGAPFHIGGNTDNQVQAILAQGSDNNFRLVTINKSASNVALSEVARLGVRYATITDDSSGIQFLRGNSATEGHLGLYTGGTTRLYVQGVTGNVGIGTTNPFVKLEVTAENTSELLRITRTNAGEQAGIGFAAVGTTNRPLIGCRANDFVFDVGGSEAARITSGGLVGIGTSAPSAFLEVKGGADNTAVRELIAFGRPDSAVRGAMGTGVSTGNGVFFGSTTAQPLALLTGNTERVRIDSDGKVGIGTTDPGNLLSLAGSAPRIEITDTDTSGRFLIDCESSSGSVNMRVDQDNAVAGSKLQVTIDNSEKLRITSDGNVGIGTSDPATKLVVADAAPVLRLLSTSTVPATENLLQAIEFFQSDVSGGQGVSAKISGIAANLSGAMNLAFSTGDAANLNERLRIAADGKVGIGTTNPGRNLTVDGDAGTIIAAFQSTGTGCGFGLKDATTSADNIVTIRAIGNDLVSHAGGQERMRIDSDGNVGIGTSSPSQKLTVSGGNILLDSNDQLRFGTSNAAFIEGSGNDGSGGTRYMRFAVNGEAMRIDSAGRLLVGTSSAETIYGATSALQVAGSNFNTASISLLRTGDGTNDSCALYLSRQRSTGILANGDRVGLIAFAGRDTTDLNTPLATIEGTVDGTPGANDMPGRLVFSTTADGASTPTPRMTIKNDGKVGIGTSSPGATLDVNGDIRARTITSDTVYSTANMYALQNVGGTLSSILWRFVTGANDVTAGTERARIDSSGRLLVGTSTAYPSYTGTPQFQISGTGTSDASAMLRCDVNTQTGASIISFTKSRGAKGTQAIVQSNDYLGFVTFAGSDGTNFIAAARIDGQVDGTPGANDMPGRLVFSTTADGASTPTERMRIKNDGTINFSNVAVYADNTAAKAGGLVDGDVYRTSTGDLKIVYT